MSYHEWKDQLRLNKKVRFYQHLDNPVDLDIQSNFQKVTATIDNINIHQFLPFIKRIDKKIRFRKGEKNKPVRTLKLRPISYASHMDSHIYSFFSFILEKDYEEYLTKNDLSENVIAYRKIRIDGSDKGKSNINFAKEVFDYISELDDCVVITQDIEKFFDNLNHVLLKEKICKISGVDKLDDRFYKVFRSLTAYRYIDYKDFIENKIKQQINYSGEHIFSIIKNILKENRSNKGIPQGSTISGLFANIYLIDFDHEIIKEYPEVFYRRYCDDLLFVCKKGQEKDLIEFIRQRIERSKLQINLKKSYIAYFKRESGDNLICELVTDGLGKKEGRRYVDYLGFELGGKEMFFRKHTIQKLKGRQINKAQRQLLNRTTPNRFKPKNNSKHINNRTNYIIRAANIINNRGISKQVLKVTKDRNKVKRHKI